MSLENKYIMSIDPYENNKSSKFAITLYKEWDTPLHKTYEVIVLEKPRRKWYKVLLEIISFKMYEAPYEHKIKFLQ